MGSSSEQSRFNINNIATSLNEKAEIDFTNVTDAAYIKMAGASMPSGTAVSLTLGADHTEYIMPADGYLYLNKTAGTGGGHTNLVAIDGGVSKMTYVYNTGDSIVSWVPVRKSERVRIDFDSNSIVRTFLFIYAQGSESEA